MSLDGRPPQPKPPKVKPDPAYMAKVRALPCVCCGAYGVEAHHCRDAPMENERGLYQRIPGAGMRSGDRDAIPLCPFHHRMFHLYRRDFHAEFGKDYGFIAPTRATLSERDLDF